MLTSYVKPPYRLVLRNDEEAMMYAGDDIVACFNGGCDDGFGHRNGRFIARAGNSYATLMAAVQAAYDLLPVMNLAKKNHEALRERLEAALRTSDFEPETIDRQDLDDRLREIKVELAAFSVRRSPLSAPPVISEQEGKLLDEMNEIEFLLGLD